MVCYHEHYARIGVIEMKEKTLDSFFSSVEESKRPLGSSQFHIRPLLKRTTKIVNLLSMRNKKILELVEQGKTVEEISKECSLRESTVEIELRYLVSEKYLEEKDESA